MLDALISLHGAPPAGYPSREPWISLLAQPPFSNASDFRHARYGNAHGRLCAAYAKRCGSLWRPDPVQRWLHSCAARLVSMHESSVFAADLTAARTGWSKAPLCLQEALSKDYADLLPEEGVNEAPMPPPVIDRAVQARLHPPRGLGAFGGIRGQHEQLTPTISLHSPAFLVFFQSLMPWGVLDVSGAVVDPVRWSDLILGPAGIAKEVAYFTAGLCSDVVQLLIMAAKEVWSVLKANGGAVN